MTLRVEVDKHRCISSGLCGDEPTAFGFDEFELAEPLAGASELDLRRLLELARNCPSEAISVYDDDVVIPIE